MKTSKTASSLLSVSLCALTFSFGAASAAEKPESPKDRKRSLAKELEHVRESLHDAQRELAEKSERIEKLEKDLANSKRSQNPKANPEKRPMGKISIEKKEKPKKEASRTVSPTDKPAPRLFMIDYEKNSAANFEGRAAALAWVKAQRQREPGLRFAITGSANDSEYAEVNQLIAENRARYLADFLALSGVPSEAISSVKGAISMADGAAGRCALVVVGTTSPKAKTGKAE